MKINKKMKREEDEVQTQLQISIFQQLQKEGFKVEETLVALP